MPSPQDGRAHTMFAVHHTHDVLQSSRPAEVTLNGELAIRFRSLRHARDRADFLAARILTQRLLSRWSGHEAGEWPVMQCCESCGGPHGRPYVSPPLAIEISWSHARGIVAAAASRHAVGIDVETLETNEPPPTYGCSMSRANDLTRWLAWTRAEALVKWGAGDLDQILGWDLAWAPQTEGSDLQLDRTACGRNSVVLTDVIGDEWLATVASVKNAVRVIGLV